MLGTLRTPGKRGVRIVGDRFDLESLHHTASGLASSQPDTSLLLAFCFDIRHAFESADTVEVGTTEDERGQYRYADVAWPTALVCTAILRRLAGYRPTTLAEQASLYALEAAIQGRLKADCPRDAADCLLQAELVARAMTEKYDFWIFTELERRSFLDRPTAALRMKGLRGMLVSARPGSREYTELKCIHAAAPR